MTESMIRGRIERAGDNDRKYDCFLANGKRGGGGMPVTGRSGRASGGTRAACGAFAKKAARVLLLER